MSSNNNYRSKRGTTYTTYDTNSIDTNTTFVQADPSNFRSVVQRLTGSLSSSSSSASALRQHSDVGARRNAASFKLHERRQGGGGMRKLEMIKLNNNNNNNNNYEYNQHGPVSGNVRPKEGRSKNNDMVSPVSTLDGLGLGIGSPSPRSSSSSMSLMMSEEKEREIIAEKGFYLHPSSNARDFHEPQLLPLFPLHSLREFQD